MFIRFREVTATRYGPGKRACTGECKGRPRLHVRGSFWVEGRTFREGCPRKPICPLLEPITRLDVSIVETRREGGKVKQAHVASLGSLREFTARQRVAFWEECDARLARLANRLGPEAERLRAAVEARIPIPTDDEFWDSLEKQWDNYAKRRAYESSDAIENAKKQRALATMGEVMVQKTKSLRGNPKARQPVSLLLGEMIIMGMESSDKALKKFKDGMQEIESLPDTPCTDDPAAES